MYDISMWNDTQESYVPCVFQKSPISDEIFSDRFLLFHYIENSMFISKFDHFVQMNNLYKVGNFHCSLFKNFYCICIIYEKIILLISSIFIPMLDLPIDFRLPIKSDILNSTVYQELR